MISCYVRPDQCLAPQTAINHEVAFEYLKHLLKQSFPRQDDALCTIEVETFVPSRATRAVQARIVHCREQSTAWAHTQSLTLCLCPPTPPASTYVPTPTSMSQLHTYQPSPPLPMPAYTQYHNGTGHDWCSPTALVMVLGYWYTQTGWDHLKPLTSPESIATHIVPVVNDPAYSTGNWSFNTAYAARLGLEAYVTHLESTHQLAAWLTAGVPMIASIAWKPTELDNAPIPNSDGHLVTIRGMASDGSVLVADSAGADPSQVLRSYRLDQFMACWYRYSAGTAYMIYQPDPDRLFRLSHTQKKGKNSYMNTNMNTHQTRIHHVSRIMQRICIVCVVLLVACAAPPPAPKQGNISSAGQAAAPDAESQNEKAGSQTGDDTNIPQEQDTLIFASDMSNIPSLDPAEAYEVESSLIVGNMYETLIQHNPDTMDLQGVLAKTWTIEERNHAWSIVFTLNEASTFASGNPVTAEDVVFSWRRVIELNRQPAFLFTDVAQLTPDNIQATGTHTVHVHIPKTTNPQVFLSLLSFSFAAVVDSAVVQEHETDSADTTWLHNHSAGSGPYMLERWDQNERMVLQANPFYWHEPPFIPTIIIRDIADQADVHALIRSGEADIVQDISSAQAKALENTPDVAVVAVETLDLIYIGMNVGTESPFANPNVREAVRYAINYNELKALLENNAIVTQEIIPSGLLGRTGLHPFEHNPTKARELLNTAGWDKATAIEFLVPTGSAPGGIEWSTLASKIAYDLDQVGLTINVVQTEQLLDIYRAAKHEMVMMIWSPDYPDPDANMTPFTDYDTRSVGWRNQWNNPEITKLVRKAAQEQDALNRIALYRVITERIQHEGPYAVLYQPSRLYALRRSIRGFRYNAAYSPSILFSLIKKE